MHWKLLHPNEYIHAPELKGKYITLTIEKILMEDVRGRDGTIKTKGTIYFKETKKKYIPGKLKTEKIASILGKDTDNWIGKKIIMYPTTINAFGDPKYETIDFKRYAEKTNSQKAIENDNNR